MISDIGQTNVINASEWPYICRNKKIIYSPNTELLQLNSNNIEHDIFWENTQTPFACVIYDTITQQITAIRDHFGVEPFYYHSSKGRFIFGSSLPAIINHLHVPLTLNSLQMTNLFFNKLFNQEIYSDETYYQSIYRVEPGHKLLITSEGKLDKKSFWNLNENKQTIFYSNKNDYLERFAELLSEAMHQQTAEKKFAIEFSGGIDSTALVACATQHKMEAELFMHVSPVNSEIQDDRTYADQVIRHLGITSINFVDASQYDFIKSMNEYAHYFAGGAPYVEPILAHNIRHQIAARGHTLVLSGVGGDECVSNHASIRISLSQLKKEQGYKKAWRELQAHFHLKKRRPNQLLKEVLYFIKLAHPKLFSIVQHIGDPFDLLRKYLKHQTYLPLAKQYNSLCDYEYDCLQGKYSHHLRMRIEYSNVAAKALGLRYTYPLLYPKLVEFCYNLPLEQKRFNGQGRYLIRNYLGRYFPKELYNNYRKTGAVTPATLSKIQMAYNEGVYKELFNGLPFQKELCFLQKRRIQSEHQLFLHHIPSFMFKIYWSNELLNLDTPIYDCYSI